MSLESAILALTAAVEANTAALQTAPTGSRKKADKTAAPSEPAASSGTSSTPAASAPGPATPVQSPTSPAPTTPAVPAVDLKAWTDAFCKLGDTSRAGREAALAILGKFKVERASLVKPENYAEALVLAQAAQAQIDNAPASAQSLV